MSNEQHTPGVTIAPHPAGDGVVLTCTRCGWTRVAANDDPVAYVLDLIGDHEDEHAPAALVVAPERPAPIDVGTRVHLVGNDPRCYGVVVEMKDHAARAVVHWGDDGGRAIMRTHDVERLAVTL